MSVGPAKGAARHCAELVAPAREKGALAAQAAQADEADAKYWPAGHGVAVTEAASAASASSASSARRAEARKRISSGHPPCEEGKVHDSRTE